MDSLFLSRWTDFHGNPFQYNIHIFLYPLPLFSCSLCRGNTISALTLSVLSILVASHGVHAVTGGAVGGRTVGLGSREAVHGLDGVTPLAAAGRDGVGGVQATVKGRDGEVSLGLRRNPAGVAQDAHHLEKRRRQRVNVWRRKATCAAAFMHTKEKQPTHNGALTVEDAISMKAWPGWRMKACFHQITRQTPQLAPLCLTLYLKDHNRDN